MIQLRKAADRGHANHGWLDSHHTFSFASYYDPNHMGFRNLRVINEDRVAPAQGFGTHGHRDMEIISYVIDGALEHKDSMGTTSIIRPGEVQRMTAGTGVMHSEYNHSKQDLVHFLQIWILPERDNLKPGYEQKDFSKDFGDDLTLVASREGENGSVRVHQDMNLYVGKPSAGVETTFSPGKDRHIWVQMVSGELDVNGQKLEAGDGAAISDVESLNLKADQASEYLLFDLA